MDVATCAQVLQFGIQQHPELENNLGLYHTLLEANQPEDLPKPPNDPINVLQQRRQKKQAMLGLSEVPPITEEEHMLLLEKAKELLMHINPSAVYLRKLPVLSTRKARV